MSFIEAQDGTVVSGLSGRAESHSHKDDSDMAKRDQDYPVPALESHCTTHDAMIMNASETGNDASEIPWLTPYVAIVDKD
ncbi:hypothetical protein PAXINDRAFT_8425 [Paxillus involutus ATCC 200175]|nr:hypothetical protein PAXINDRAFT_8425 [Paxillus involutus ATCC 200175]